MGATRATGTSGRSRSTTRSAHALLSGGRRSTRSACSMSASSCMPRRWTSAGESSGPVGGLRRPTVSAALLMQGEEQHVAACLRGLTWADELVVLDGGSRNRAPELARAAGATVHHRPFDNFGAQRQALIGLTSCDWVFFVDIDERVSSGLAAEIRDAIACTDEGAPVGYWVPRRNYIWGRWIRG